MALADDIEELTPLHAYRPGDERTFYWICDGKVLYHRSPVRGAHVSSFRFYLSDFAKDEKNCYHMGSRLSGGNGATFRALNYCYATDGQFVWTLGGKVKDADAQSFVVCDDGVQYLTSGARVPYGFAKDKDRVYYADSSGKPKWVRKADPESFISLNDSYFGKDKKFVFCGSTTFPKANVLAWHKIGGHYSKDDRRVYYFNRPIAVADYDTFEFVDSGRDYVQLAKDKDKYYWNDNIVSADKFSAMLAESRSP